MFAASFFKSNSFYRKPLTCSHSAVTLPVVVAIGR